MASFNSNSSIALVQIKNLINSAKSFEDLDNVYQDAIYYANKLPLEKSVAFKENLEKFYDEKSEKFTVELIAEPVKEEPINNEQEKNVDKENLANKGLKEEDASPKDEVVNKKKDSQREKFKNKKSDHDNRVEKLAYSSVPADKKTALIYKLNEILEKEVNFRKQIGELVSIIDNFTPDPKDVKKNKVMSDLNEFMKPFRNLVKSTDELSALLDAKKNGNITQDEFINKSAILTSQIFRDKEYWSNIQDGVLTSSALTEFFLNNAKIIKTVFDEVTAKLSANGSAPFSMVKIEDYFPVLVQRGARMEMFANELNSLSVKTPIAQYFSGNNALKIFVKDRMLEIADAQNKPNRDLLKNFIDVINDIIDKGKIKDSVKDLIDKVKSSLDDIKLKSNGSTDSMKEAYKNLEMALNTLRAYSAVHPSAELNKVVSKIDNEIKKAIKKDDGVFHQIDPKAMYGDADAKVVGIKDEVKADLKAKKGNFELEKRNVSAATHAKHKAPDKLKDSQDSRKSVEDKVDANIFATKYEPMLAQNKVKSDDKSENSDSSENKKSPRR